MTFDEWLAIGYANGWCGPTICETHDGLPLTASEEKEFEDGDPCIHILRLYEDEGVRNGVEENHGPSVWRASNSGLIDNHGNPTEI
jgi:hypothetical protein